MRNQEDAMEANVSETVLEPEILEPETKPKFPPRRQASRWGMGSVRLKGNIWEIRYRQNGKQKTESSHSREKADARRLLKKRLDEIRRGKLPVVETGQLTVEAMLTRVKNAFLRKNRKSVARLDLAVKHLTGYFGGRKASTITAADIDQYVIQRRGEGCADSSLNKELGCLGRGFKFAIKDRFLEWMPEIPFFKCENVREGYVTETQFEKIKKGLDEPIQDVAQFGFIAGWRKGEILGLLWRQVDWHTLTIRLPGKQTKNGKPRLFPFKGDPILRALFEKRRETTRRLERETGRIIQNVFTWEDGRLIKCFRGNWDRACTAAGLPGLLFHDLRRSACRAMVRAGLREPSVMDLLGHKTRSMFDRYAIMDEEDLEADVAKLAQARKEAPPEPEPQAEVIAIGGRS
jgi:integrase